MQHANGLHGRRTLDLLERDQQRVDQELNLLLLESDPSSLQPTDIGLQIPVITVFRKDHTLFRLFLLISQQYTCEVSFRLVELCQVWTHFSLLIYLHPDKPMLPVDSQINELVKVLILVPRLFDPNPTPALLPGHFPSLLHLRTHAYLRCVLFAYPQNLL